MELNFIVIYLFFNCFLLLFLYARPETSKCSRATNATKFNKTQAGFFNENANNNNCSNSSNSSSNAHGKSSDSNNEITSSSQRAIMNSTGFNFG